MNRIASFLLAGLLAGAAVQTAGALPAVRPSAVPAGLVATASGDCRAIGQQIASQNGGTLADAHVENRNGQNVCVGVVVVPARDGERGRQIPFAVPM